MRHASVFDEQILRAEITNKYFSGSGEKISFLNKWWRSGGNFEKQETDIGNYEQILLRNNYALKNTLPYYFSNKS